MEDTKALRLKYQQLQNKWERIVTVCATHNHSFISRIRELGITANEITSFLMSIEERARQKKKRPLNIVTSLEARLLLNKYNEIVFGDDKVQEPLFKEIAAFFLSDLIKQCEQFPARKGFIIHLFQETSSILSRVLIKEQRFFFKKSSDEKHNVNFGGFIKEYANQQMVFSILERYPVLQDLITTKLDQLSVFYQEINSRFTQDKEALISQGLIAIDAKWLDVELGLSDPHRGGKTVAVLHFNTGEKLVYKPHSLGLDVAFQKLLGWMNMQLKEVVVPTSLVLDKTDYGWTEYIETKEVETSEELQRYFKRLGQLNILFYFLCGVDMHPNNFVRQGEYPVPIDFECLFAPQLHTIISPQSTTDNLTTFDTLLYTGMSPYWYFTKDRSHSFYSLGIEDSSRMFPIPSPEFTFSAEKGVSCTFAYRQSKNIQLLQWNKEKIDPLKYKEAFFEGIESMYHLFLQYKEELLTASSPLMDFKELPSRVLLRSTKEYTQTLFYSLAPDNLQSFADHFIATERIYAHNPRFSEGQTFFKVIESEKESLSQGDVPLFWGYTTDKFLWNDRGETIGEILEHTPFDQAVHRIQKSSLTDLEWQLGMLRAVYEMIEISNEEHRNRRNELPKGIHHQNWAYKIGEQLSRLAVLTERGAVWLDIYPVDPNAVYTNLVVCTPNLYAGTAGVGYFLSMLGKVTQEQQFISLGKQAVLWGLNKSQHNIENDSPANISLSAFEGVFSTIYAGLYQLEIEYDEGLCHKIQTVLASISFNDFIAQPKDYLGGWAGTCLVLKKAADYFESTDLVLMLDRLIRYVFSEIKGNLIKKNGMAHGAAGYALTFLRAYQWYGKKDYLDLAMQLIAKDIKYIEKLIDQQPIEKWPKHTAWWCKGLPGIGLVVLEFIKAGFIAEYQETLNVITAQIIQQTIPKKHHLCCGATGRLMFLSELYSFTNEQEIYDQLEKESLALLDDYLKSGKWKHQQLQEGTIIPGLFNGSSGMGYALLKVALPDLPNIFLLP